MDIFHKFSFDDIEASVGEKIANNIINARNGKISINEGGGGVYGQIKINN
jgi:PHP family Zn ribbon phosphoesterase